MKKLSVPIIVVVALLCALLVVPALPQIARADGPDGNILNYSVWGDGGVSLAQGTSINGGKLGSKESINGYHSDYVKDGVRAGGDFGVGNAFRTEESILVNGNVKMVYNGSVSGDVKAGGSISLGKGTVVGGSVVPSAGTPADPLPTLPAIITPCTGNNDNRNVGSGLTLAPGTYGEVRWSVNTPGPLRLSEGKYVFKRLKGTNGARIEINLTNPGDDITICVEESMAGFGNSSKIVLTGAPSNDIYWQVQGDKAAFANGVTFVGTLFVPDGDISFGNSASVTGALYAGASSPGGMIKFGNGSEVSFALAQQFIDLIVPPPPPPPVFSVFGSSIIVDRSDVLSGLLGTYNGGNITSANNATGGGGVRCDGDFSSSVGPFKTSGDLIANGNVTFTGNYKASIGGNVIAGGTITDGINDLVPDIKEFPNTTPAPYTPPTLPAPIADFSGLPGLGNRGAGDLAPGIYNNVAIGAGTLTLHSGTYIMNSLSAGNGPTINIDLSPAPNQIKIFIKGQLYLFNNSAKINLTGGGSAADVYWEVHGTGDNGGGVGLKFIGTLYAPYGAIKMAGNTSQVDGALYAGQSVTFGNSTTVNFVPVTVTGAPALP
jgi:hypothetical protein